MKSSVLACPPDKLLARLAEREGFEPSIRFCRILTFQASAFDHSATAPHALERAHLVGGGDQGKLASRRSGKRFRRTEVEAAAALPTSRARRGGAAPFRSARGVPRMARGSEIDVCDDGAAAVR